MRPIDADTLIIELEKDEALFDNEAMVARENSIKYTDNYAKIMWSRANGIRDAIIEVYDAPTIDAVEVVHGEWIEGGTVYFCGEQHLPLTCSVCGKTALNEPWTYCPNCGARMKGAENKECHKPESLYYRAFCEERKDSAYCDGCEFWY